MTAGRRPLLPHRAARRVSTIIEDAVWIPPAKPSMIFMHDAQDIDVISAGNPLLPRRAARLVCFGAAAAALQACRVIHQSPGWQLKPITQQASCSAKHLGLDFQLG